MEKKIIFLLLIFAFLPFISGDGITINDVFLNEQIKIDANFQSVGMDNNTLCKFLFYETNSGLLVDRATDEYSLDNNHVYNVDYTILEPPFFRDTNYSISVICSNQILTETFMVNNMRSVGFAMQKNIEFALKPQHLDFILISVFLLGGIAILLYILWFFYKMGGY